MRRVDLHPLGEKEGMMRRVDLHPLGELGRMRRVLSLPSSPVSLLADTLRTSLIPIFLVRNVENRRVYAQCTVMLAHGERYPFHCWPSLSPLIPSVSHLCLSCSNLRPCTSRIVKEDHSQPGITEE